MVPPPPYKVTLVEGLTGRWITPYDWFEVARACLEGGDFLLQEVDYEELAEQEAVWVCWWGQECTLQYQNS